MGAFSLYAVILMQFSLSTAWNAYRHTCGEALVDEIISMGFNSVELGYSLRQELVDGVLKRIREGAVSCRSVHNYCPVPIGAHRGHPELFSLSSLSSHERASAVRYTAATVEFAVRAGASTVVAHAGNVHMRPITRKLIELAENGKFNTRKYEKLKLKLLMRREKKAGKHLEQLYRSLEELLPLLQNSGVALALENLPSWEALPTETEAIDLLQKFDSPFIRYWHDMGHGQIRHNLGLISHRLQFEKLSPWLAGMHIHDVAWPAGDHIMPPKGSINFSDFNNAPRHANILVLEPRPGVPAEDITVAADLLLQLWSNNR